MDPDIRRERALRSLAAVQELVQSARDLHLVSPDHLCWLLDLTLGELRAALEQERDEEREAL